MAKEICNYDKYSINDLRYYGLHNKKGRVHIDTKRIKKLKLQSVFPEEIFTRSRNTHYFIPKYPHDDGYKVNFLFTCLQKLKSEWNQEYKVAISKLTTPKEVYESSYIKGLNYCGSVHDNIDSVEFDAQMDAFKRMNKYINIVRSIHLQYLQKVFVEYFRAIIVMIRTEDKYKEITDYTFPAFIRFVEEKTGKPGKANPLFSLENYRWLNLLNKLDNFIKHNSERAYNDLHQNAFEQDEIKTFLSKYVYFDTTGEKVYKTGMYAGDWVVIDSNFIDEIIEHLFDFSGELCSLVYGEDPKEAVWNYDDYFKNLVIDNFIDIF